MIVRSQEQLAELLIIQCEDADAVQEAPLETLEALATPLIRIQSFVLMLHHLSFMRSPSIVLQLNLNKPSSILWKASISPDHRDINDLISTKVNTEDPTSKYKFTPTVGDDLLHC
jgi:hypothetical protein